LYTQGLDYKPLDKNCILRMDWLIIEELSLLNEEEKESGGPWDGEVQEDESVMEAVVAVSVVLVSDSVAGV